MVCAVGEEVNLLICSVDSVHSRYKTQDLVFISALMNGKLFNPFITATVSYTHTIITSSTFTETLCIITITLLLRCPTLTCKRNINKCSALLQHVSSLLSPLHPSLHLHLLPMSSFSCHSPLFPHHLPHVFRPSCHLPLHLCLLPSVPSSDPVSSLFSFPF